MSVASVNVWSGSARIRTPWSGSRIAPGYLETAVNITTFIISRMYPTTNGSRRRGSWIFGTLGRIMVTTTFNTDKLSGAIGFSMPV